jgi:hypothetical protein
MGKGSIFTNAQTKLMARVWEENKDLSAARLTKLIDMSDFPDLELSQIQTRFSNIKSGNVNIDEFLMTHSDQEDSDFDERSDLEPDQDSADTAGSSDSDDSQKKSKRKKKEKKSKRPKKPSPGRKRKQIPSSKSKKGTTDMTLRERHEESSTLYDAMMRTVKRVNGEAYAMEYEKLAKPAGQDLAPKPEPEGFVDVAESSSVSPSPSTMAVPLSSGQRVLAKPEMTQDELDQFEEWRAFRAAKRPYNSAGATIDLEASPTKVAKVFPTHFYPQEHRISVETLQEVSQSKSPMFSMLPANNDGMKAYITQLIPWGEIPFGEAGTKLSQGTPFIAGARKGHRCLILALCLPPYIDLKSVQDPSTGIFLTMEARSPEWPEGVTFPSFKEEVKSWRITYQIPPPPGWEIGESIMVKQTLPASSWWTVQIPLTW